MITIRFRALLGGLHSEVGPAEGYRLGGNFLRELPRNVVVGKYENYHWVVDDRVHTRFDCQGAVEIYFEDAEGAQTERFGPFQHLFAANGTIFCEEEIFAKFTEETILWHSRALGTYWPWLVIAPPETENS